MKKSSNTSIKYHAQNRADIINAFKSACLFLIFFAVITKGEVFSWLPGLAVGWVIAVIWASFLALILVGIMWVCRKVFKVVFSHGK